MDSCVFCQLDPHLIIEKHPHFNLILDPYPLCQGHLMIVAAEHYGCAGELPAAYFSEFGALVSRAGAFLESRFGQWIAYEHGRSGTCHSGQESSCDHMHLHLLPLDIDLHETLSSQFPSVDINRWEEMRKYFHGWGEYLFFRNVQGIGKYYSTLHTQVPSHLIRTLIAEQIQSPELASWENCLDQKVDPAQLEIKSQILHWSAS